MTNGQRPDGINGHISRLRALQKEAHRQQRIAALSARMVNMKSGWLLVKVEDGSPASIRQVKLLADGMTVQLP